MQDRDFQALIDGIMSIARKRAGRCPTPQQAAAVAKDVTREASKPFQDLVEVKVKLAAVMEAGE